MTTARIDLADGSRIEVTDDPDGVVLTAPAGLWVSIPADRETLQAFLYGFTQVGNGLIRFTAANVVLHAMWSSEPSSGIVEVTVATADDSARVGPVVLTLAERVHLWELLDQLWGW